MMTLKPGVRTRGVQTETVLALIITEAFFREHSLPLMITSITDGEHMPGSFHHAGLAYDIRIQTGLTDTIVEQLGAALGKEWQVLYEATHVHCEYDPA